MRTVIFLGLAILISGCAATEPVVRTVRVPVPVECQQSMPERPQMDTEFLPLDAAVDEQARAMRAEIERREGYEQRLVSVVRACGVK